MPKVWTCLILLLLVPSALAQFDPLNGQWGKDDPRDLRVMTWNVEDNIATNNTKTEALNSWSALTRIVASMKPDILILQECGDTGSGVDSVTNLETVVELFFHGGTDPFLGGTVTSYVQLYDPAYDLPYVFVSISSDGFNRNVILSRFPFADLNGDGKDQLSDTPFIFSDQYSPGPNGGIRGFQHAEIDLPDDDYKGDLVIGNSHLKAGSGADDKDDRLRASQTIAYFLDYLYNGAGTGIPDPNAKILDIPPATDILDTNTAIIAGGDWNEDESSNGRKGPAEWICFAALSDGQGGGDGTDKDQSDMTFDSAVEPFGGSDATQSSSKLDYLSWQDDVANLKNSFVFHSAAITGGHYPPELLGYSVSPALASGFASDHRPVICDFELPEDDPPPPGPRFKEARNAMKAICKVLGLWEEQPQNPVSVLDSRGFLSPRLSLLSPGRVGIATGTSTVGPDFRSPSGIFFPGLDFLKMTNCF